MKTLYPFLLFCCCIVHGSSYTEHQEGRYERMFSLFNVVKFKNTGCQATSSASLQGVCYTKQECEDLGGTSDGNCAASFGVCCIVSVSGTDAACSATVTQNCTYIQNPTYPSARTTAGTCTYMINRCSTDICQIRLDFMPTVLSQPDSTAATRGTCGGTAADALVMTPGAGNVAANNIPTLCGTLTGQHVYLEASRTADLAATLAITTIASTTTSKNWRIKVSQIECHSRNKAPQGCLQYFTGMRSTVTSFNFDGTSALATGGEIAKQDYKACFRQEAGMCGLQFSESVLANGADAFDLDSKTTALSASASSLQTTCAQEAANQCGTVNGGNLQTCDYIEIPGGSIVPNTATSAGDLFCGAFLNPTDAATQSAAVTTTRRPFELRHVVVGVRDNSAEAGYSLDATQVPC